MNAKPAFLTALATAALLIALGTPTTTADPPCTGTCTVDASASLLDAPGYDPAVLVIVSGTSVVWHSTDGKTHAHAELGAASNCIGVSSSASEDSPPVLFEISNGALVATGGSTSTCGGAVGAGDGPFLLKYHCALHPNMNAAIVVLPAL